MTDDTHPDPQTRQNEPARSKQNAPARSTRNAPVRSTHSRETAGVGGDRADVTREDETRGGPPRRDFLKTLCAGGVTGTVGTGTATAADDAEFVETDGTQFVVGDRPIYFSGSNNFWIMDPYADRSLVDRLFQFYEDLELNFVRTWAFCSGGSGPKCLQPEPGVYNESGLEHLDYVIHRASEHGIRLAFALTNNWTDYGGMDQYVEWASGASDHVDFYTNEECRTLYREYVETLLTRENSITGREYREDPTIAIWELANEPRAKGDPEGLEKATSWMADMSAFIKGVDSNHLVSTGMEGFYATDPDGDWRHDGSHGTAFVDQHQIDTIDACSFHMYPHHWPGLAAEDGSEWVKEHVVDAHETVGKPVYCGEFGVHDSNYTGQARQDLYQQWFDTFDEFDIDGQLVWQLRVSDSSDDGFGVVEGSNDGILDEVVAPYTDRVYEKSGGDGDANGPPYADATGPSSVRRGESATFDGAWSFDPERSLSTYEWSLGDGATATGETARRRYDSTGSYDVSLTVTDDGGATATDTETVDVTALPEGAVLVEGAGEKVHREVNECHYAYTRMSGDFTVTAKVADVDAISGGTQAGVMVRGGLEPSAPAAATAITPDDGAEFLRSYDAESPTWRGRPEAGREPPVWVRLERADGMAYGSISRDGSNWTEFDSGQVELPEAVFVGLFASSHSPGDLATVQFEQVPWFEDWESTDVGDVEVPGHAVVGSGSGTDLKPIGGTTPQDIDGDGQYRDLNANDEVDFDDVVTYFDNMDESAMTDHVGAYDYNGNDEVDFADVVALFDQV